MNHAEKCPVCKGAGKVSSNNASTTGPYFGTCHGCGGKGWVTVQDIQTTEAREGLQAADSGGALVPCKERVNPAGVDSKEHNEPKA